MVHFPSDAVLIARILLGGFLAGLVGLEREISQHPAGLRTHVSLGLGAALFGVLSVAGFGLLDIGNRNTPFGADLSRIASNVVVGVGFIGGGVILKDQRGIRGITTAASLWVTAAIGLGAGLGLYVPSAVTCVVLLAALVGLRPITPRLPFLLSSRAGSTVLVTLRPGAEVGPLVSLVSQRPGLQLRSVRFGRAADSATLRAEVLGSGPALDDLLAVLADHPDVIAVDQDR